MAFESADDFEAYYQEHGEAALMGLARSGRLGEKGMRLFVEWQAMHDVRMRDAQNALAARDVEANERAADAAEASAASAKTSARWAIWAVIVAVLALIVSLSKGDS